MLIKKVDDYSAVVPETNLAGKKIGVLESFLAKKQNIRKSTQSLQRPSAF